MLNTGLDEAAQSVLARHVWFTVRQWAPVGGAVTTAQQLDPDVSVTEIN